MEHLTIGSGDDERRIAVLHQAGEHAPGLFWLGGFMSDMRGSKASAFAMYGAEHKLPVVRFDYSGHGASGGRFADGTISRWLEEARAVFDAHTAGPQIIAGSSMGGWLALLLARQLLGTGRAAGLLLLAPAVDMTRALMWDRWDEGAREALMRDGVYHEPSDYSDTPYPITRGLIEDGDRHLFGNGLIEAGCAVHILQGMQDTDVPPRHAHELVTRLASDDVVLTLIKDGDHRLSRPDDLERMRAALDGLRADFA